MCGICGMAGKSDRDLLERMYNVIVHRGPDDEGMYRDENAAIASRRLSIIDLETGHQPMSNEDGSLWIVYNGEIYNYNELRRLLLTKGHTFRTKSDTEVILHAYEEFGENCLSHLNGMFAIAIWNKKKRALFLARDRVGLKPLYFWTNKNYLLFGSEIKSILQDPSFRREINFTTLYNYLGRLYVPGTETFFCGIRKLEPGHFLKFSNNTTTITKYWELDFSKDTNRDEAYYTRKTLDLLKRSVKRRLVSDVPVGCFLSGGVDSSAIAALMKEESSEPIRTYSLGFEEATEMPFNELPYAKKVADNLHTLHFEFVAKAKDLLEYLPEIVWHFDQPFAGALPQYLLSKLAATHVKVALSGLGGDEIFGNYGKGQRLLKYMSDKALFYNKLPGRLRTKIIENLMVQALSKISENLQKRVSEFVQMPATIYANLYCPFNDHAKLDLCTPDLLEKVRPTQTLPRIYQNLRNAANSGNPLDQALYIDLKSQLVDEYLQYTDALSMAHSQEVRAPFLDHELIEFAISVPWNIRSNNGEPKYMLKKALAAILPPDILGRRKGGFSLPIGEWIRQDLKPLVLTLLAPERIIEQGYFKAQPIQTLLNEHFNNLTNHTPRIWNLFMFQLWHKIYIEDRCENRTDLLSL